MTLRHPIVGGPPSVSISDWTLIRDGRARLGGRHPVKNADDGDRIIVRFYEATGRDADVRIRFGDSIAAASENDLTEQGNQPLKIENGTIHVPTRPCEIHTIAVRLQRRR